MSRLLYNYKIYGGDRIFVNVKLTKEDKNHKIKKKKDATVYVILTTQDMI